MTSITLTSTRDILRYRPFKSPLLSTLTNNFLTLLSSPSSNSIQLRTAFFPSILNRMDRPRDSNLLKQVDEILMNYFKNALNHSNPEEGGLELVIVQGKVGEDGVERAWSRDEEEGKKGMESKIFLGFALHSELERAKDEGEREVEANLSMMVLATLTYELAEWIYVKNHGHNPLPPLSPSSPSSFNSTTSSSRASIYAVSTMNSSYQEPTHQPNRLNTGVTSGYVSVGQKAVHNLFGFDYELLAYTIGERQLVKRLPLSPIPFFSPSLQSLTSISTSPSSSITNTKRSKPALLTPPLIYTLIGDTPSIPDVTQYAPSTLRSTPTWKENDKNDGMWSIVSILRSGYFAGGIIGEVSGVRYHGVCEIKFEGVEGREKFGSEVSTFNY